MVELRPLRDEDVSLVEVWLHKDHVRRWYEIPRLGVSIEDWLYELNERQGEFRWLTHLIVLWNGRPIGLCQYYACEDSKEEDFGSLHIAGAYGIDYLIGEEDCLGKGLGKEMITSLVDTVFSFPDAQCVTADIDNANTASKRTLVSCGFAVLDPGGSRYVRYATPAKPNRPHTLDEETVR